MVDIQLFAENTKRVLERLIDSMSDDSPDRRALENLRDDADDILTSVPDDIREIMCGVSDLIRR